MSRRSTAVYFGSLADVRPVEQYPAYDWIFVAPEPSHPAAVAHWPPGCPGHRFLHGTYFFDTITKRLRDWSCSSTSDDRWVFEREGRRLTVFANSAVGGAHERLSDDAKAALAEARGLYVLGWLPALEDVARLCPNVQTIYSPPDLTADWGIDVAEKYTHVPVREYYWNHDSEEYIFFGESEAETESDADEAATSDRDRSRRRQA